MGSEMCIRDRLRYFNGVTNETSACLNAEVRARFPIPPKIPTAVNIPRSNQDTGIFHPPKGIVNKDAMKPNKVKYQAIKYDGSVSLNKRIEIDTIAKNTQNKIGNNM